MIQEFTIDGRLDGLNEYTAECRKLAKGGGSCKRKNEAKVKNAIRNAHLKPMKTPVIVHITWIEGLKEGATRFVPRDKDNIRFAAKFVLDALVSEGVIEDDGWSHVADIADSYRLNRNAPRIIIRLEETCSKK